MARLKQFVVSEDSMRPALEPGDGLLAIRSVRLRRGQVRCFEHPWRPGFWLVKRVGDVDGTAFEARSDHEIHGVVDSRRFGPVEVRGSWLAVARIRGWRVRPLV